MKKFFFWTSILIFLFILPPISGAGSSPPGLIYIIGGTVTVNGKVMTQRTFRRFSIKVTKEGGTALDPVAETTSLLESGVYLVNIPVYDEDHTGAANPGETLEIHIYYDEMELSVTTPPNAEITMGQGGSTNYSINIVAEGDIPNNDISAVITLLLLEW